MAHVPRKRFGQNFLRDTAIIQAILSGIQAEAHEHWVEIGPGQGALTAYLLKMGLRLDVIELDRDLVALLGEKFKQQSNLRIYSNDALHFDFAALVENQQPLRIIGNLPYNISTPLMFHLLSYTGSIKDMHFMLQKEVVDRICANPGTKEYGRLSVMMRYYCAAEPLFEVPPESFTPAPKVMSAVIRLVPHRQPPVEVADVKHLNRVVTEAFSQRRKTVRNSLRKLFRDEALLALNIDPALRTEALSLSDFARMSNFLYDSQR